MKTVFDRIQQLFGKDFIMNYFIISAFGKDQIGIVAKVTAVLKNSAYNVEDSSMTRLKGEFAMLITISTKDTVSVEDINETFANIAQENNLTIELKKLSATQWQGEVAKKALARLNIHGADKLGIVAGISGFLSANNVNIYDLCTTLTPDGVFIMHFGLELPEKFNKDEFDKSLTALTSELNVHACFEMIESVEL